MPKRIQRKRTRGWKMPPNTVYVGRPTKLGNPFVIRRDVVIPSDYFVLDPNSTDVFHYPANDPRWPGGSLEAARKLKQFALTSPPPKKAQADFP